MTTPADLSLNENPARRDRPWWRTALHALADLRITVVLLGLSTFLVLAGTLAQVNHDIWEVVDGYFRCWIAYVRLADLVPSTWFPPGTPGSHYAELKGGFIFPGGWTLGLALGVNQLASMLTKFRVQARGMKLWGGLAVTAVGVGLTVAVILSGMSGEGATVEPLVSFAVLWRVFQAAAVLAAVGLTGWAVAALLDPAKRRAPQTALIVVGALAAAGLAGWSVAVGAVSDSSVRILWQLMKATAAAGVLLAGLLPIFGRQGGTFLLHCGLLLLLASEFHTGTYAREGVISLEEGTAANHVSDTRSFEFALVRTHPNGTETHHVVSGAALTAAAEADRVIDDPDLPAIVEPVEVFSNANVTRAGAAGTFPNPDDALPVAGRFGIAPLEPGTGVEAGSTDYPAALVRLRKRAADGSPGSAVGTVVTSAFFPDAGVLPGGEPVEIGGETYRAELRFAREYLPYRVALDDVRATYYPGTRRVRSYESDLTFAPLPLDGSAADPDERGGFDAFIWMNNPLRYDGRTFYQSGFVPGGDGRPDRSTLQVVTNTGWMVPYVACMILAVGMLAQFLMSLTRFLGRRGPVPTAAESRDAAEARVVAPDPDDEPAGGRWGWAFPLAVLLICGGYAASKWRPPGPVTKGPLAGFDLAAFEALPVLQGGRYKPLGTVARNALKAVNGNRQEFADGAPKRLFGPFERQPKAAASVWLLDLASDAEAADKRRVYRITNPQVLGTLGLTPRKGLTYARGEFAAAPGADDPKNDRLDEALARARAAREKQAGKTTLDADERAFLELSQQLSVRDTLTASLNPAEFSPIQMGGVFPLPAYARVYDGLRDDGTAPLAVPRGARWETPTHAAVQEGVEAEVLPELRRQGLPPAEFLTLLAGIDGGGAQIAALFAPSEFDGEPDPLVEEWADLRAAWTEKSAPKFNLAVKRIGELTAAAEADRRAAFLDAAAEKDTPATAGVGLENWFNHAAPLFTCYVLYIGATLLTLGGWALVPLGAGGPPRRAAFWLLGLTFLMHTVALGLRIYISGRPPVTNLYSSAIFIGWAAVGLGLLVEVLYGWGIGNGLACASGVVTGLIAHSEPLSGNDTFEVLEAVLDTQFWLATHVVTITLGYAAVGAAGLLGLFYVLGGLLTPALAAVVGRPGTRSAGQDLGQALAKMIYGMLCFAALLSLVGTILGGLWADDSWGRFWGWDPKENGALLIVIWTALVLHARWGKLVGERGLAVLAVAGNVAVAWSWFGVNELGEGLHSYGFTEGVLNALAWVVGGHLVVIAAGAALPTGLWWSERRRAARIS